MFGDIFWLLAGLALILYGASLLTDGASSIARRAGVSDLVVGLTVVAFGTSSPELVISLVAAADGNASLAVGNVVGSNIFNILMILGVTAMVKPIVVNKSVMTNEIPMALLSSLIVLLLGYSTVLDGSEANVISRSEGLFLLIFFMLFMRYTFASARGSGQAEPVGPGENKRSIPLWKAAVMVAAGLAGLIWGGDRFVDGASGLARSMGVSDAVIGLTIVAVGTSLPELATSVVAAVKGETGLAIGNVIGSNIFNVLLVLGAAAAVSPLPFGGVGAVDVWTLVGASVLFWACGWLIGRRTITRGEGALMTACYAAYMVYVVASA